MGLDAEYMGIYNNTRLLPMFETPLENFFFVENWAKCKLLHYRQCGAIYIVLKYSEIIILFMPIYLCSKNFIEIINTNFKVTYEEGGREMEWAGDTQDISPVSIVFYLFQKKSI